jgi:hypothetical protein
VNLDAAVNPREQSIRYPAARGRTMLPGSASRRLWITLAAACGAVAIAACGSSTNQSTGSSQSGSLVKFAVCIRSHGVPNFPDASSGPGGGVSVIPGGINTSSPAFKGAWSACNKLLSGLGAHHPPSAQALEQMLKFSQCMRAHGVTGFPDPTTTPLAPRGGYTTIRRGGVYLAIPDTINPTSPTYQQAARACRFGPVFS